MPSYEVADTCRVIAKSQDTPYALACESLGTVYMPNPCEFRGDVYAELLCHESAHVRGWPHDHSSGR